ncbi:MAG: type II toxin-antitoxin system Phd/YefM family antitoxin [Candidatus Sumerlaeota bacterium]|nr:type II toxin-antitoxin system Phd/YefM family antitoxin [Candidatus Sumerlaeota bacterium]
MNATIVDLRYRMKDVLKALERREEVRILCRGKLKGIIIPQPTRARKKVTEHPFFNSRPSDKSVEQEMDELRGGRYRDL